MPRLRARSSLLSPILWQIALGVSEDFQNRLAIVGAQVAKSAAVVPVGEYVVNVLIDVILHRCRQLLERFGIDQIAARILKQPAFQVKVAKGSTLKVARTFFREIRLERRGAR